MRPVWNSRTRPEIQPTAPAEPFTAPDGRVVDGPELAIAVVLEHTGEGSEAAAPLFRRVVEAYYGLEPTPFPWQ